MHNVNKSERIAKMSKLERFNVNKSRRYTVLNFLASGEYWTTAENVRLLFGVKHLSYVRRFLDTLIDDDLLSKRAISSGGTPRNYYSITDRGLAFVDKFEKYKAGKLSHQTMFHNELVQRLRIMSLNIFGEALKWRTDIEIQRTGSEFKSIPDAVLTVNTTYSIELQRNIYSYDGLVKKISKCLDDCYNERFDFILFVCCENLTAERLKTMFTKVDKVKNTRGEDVILLAEDREKFIFIDFNNFEEFIENEKI